MQKFVSATRFATRQAPPPPATRSRPSRAAGGRTVARARGRVSVAGAKTPRAELIPIVMYGKQNDRGHWGSTISSGAASPRVHLITSSRPHALCAGRGSYAVHAKAEALGGPGRETPRGPRVGPRTILKISNSDHVINKERSHRPRGPTNSRKRCALVTGMSLMLCISARTHCILNRHCFVFRACAPAERAGFIFIREMSVKTIRARQPINSGGVTVAAAYCSATAIGQR